MKDIPRTLSNIEDAKQVVRSSGSIEANNSLSRKAFVNQIKICRKESRESRYWLRLLDTGKEARLDKDRDGLVQEAKDLRFI